jgi:hypothetical protein
MQDLQSVRDVDKASKSHTTCQDRGTDRASTWRARRPAYEGAQGLRAYRAGCASRAKSRSAAGGGCRRVARAQRMTAGGTVALGDRPVRLPPLRNSNAADRRNDRAVRVFLGAFRRRRASTLPGLGDASGLMQQCRTRPRATGASTASCAGSATGSGPVPYGPSSTAPALLRHRLGRRSRGGSSSAPRPRASWR